MTELRFRNLMTCILLAAMVVAVQGMGGAIAATPPDDADRTPRDVHPEGGKGESTDVDAERERDYYERGTEALDENDYEECVKWFGKAAKIDGPRAAGAWYWTAYALNRLNRRSEALEALETLKAKYPESRWKNDARALEVEIRGKGAKVAPEGTEDETTKLYALNALMNVDDERAVPLLIKFLDGNHSPKLKEQALFVLVQSGTPAAREKVIAIAKGGGNPHLQRKALEFLGAFDDAPQVHAVLMDVYRTTTNPDIKRAIIQGFMVSDDVKGLYEMARTEKDPDLRRDAIHGLGVQEASDELMLLYRGNPTESDRQAIIEAIAIADHPELLMEMTRTEKSPELRVRAIHSLGTMDIEETGDSLVALYKQYTDETTREAVIQAFMMQENAPAILEVVRTEEKVELRRDAIHALGGMDEHETGDELVSIYRKFPDRDTRRAVLDAFMMQDNAQALIAVAKEEKDPELRREAIQRLGNIDSEEATKFLMKILEEESDVSYRTVLLSTTFLAATSLCAAADPAMPGIESGPLQTVAVSGNLARTVRRPGGSRRRPRVGRLQRAGCSR